MNKSEKKTSIFSLIVLLILALALVFFVYKFLTPQKKLPVYNPQDMNPDLVDSTLQNKGKGHKIADFKLINQNGEIITQENYKGKIYVADFFFTRCTTICPVMTSNMKEVQDAFIDNDKVLFLSHSVTPEMDSVPVLRAYADVKGVIDGKWNITTGDKKHIYALARKSYFAVLDEGDGGLQDFVHTENFTLIDPKGQIRGTYDGTDKAEIQRLIADIRILLKE
ncbi:MAG: SCO family protein [Flavobacteriaceae bacterium]|jgi:protein SCO1/2|nr:SCO family protein [Flavobacteriaceae bacterium]